MKELIDLFIFVMVSTERDTKANTNTVRQVTKQKASFIKIQLNKVQ